MASSYTRQQIQAAIRPRDAIIAMEHAFSAYSRGEAVVPPVGHLYFEKPLGDCHIKYGYLKTAETFTVKIATGFYENAALGLPSSNGVVLVFSRITGELLTILQDEGYLTDMRTAAAGAVAAKFLAPRQIDCIGLLGAGIQAHLQLQYLAEVTECRRVKLWARTESRARAFAVPGFDVQICSSPQTAVAGCQLIVTTTPSRTALLDANDVPAGSHITAVGADGGGKQEVAPGLFVRAALRVVDSFAQCAEYGDTSYALKERLIRAEEVIELGRIIDEPSLVRRDAQTVSIADLTGVAVQDMAIAELALRGLTKT